MTKVGFGFRSKAQNLLQLQKFNLSAQIPELITFTVGEYKKSSEAVIKTIQTKFKTNTIIIRSSASNEDSSSSSHAGEYDSVAHVDASCFDSIKNAVDKVISSYGDALDNDEFFAQIQVKDVKLSGVLFTRDLDTLAPYYIVNFDLSGSIDGITSGSSADSKTYIRFRNSKYRCDNPHVESVIKLAEELFLITKDDALDIEFAVDQNGIPYLLQVRQIVREGKNISVTDQSLSDALYRVERKIEKLNGPHPGLCGKNAIYSVMTDWNPAEIIGTKPRMLSLSMYKELIMDNIWAYQRSNYGYKNLRGFPLLVSFLGAPYIDVRASFNSFIPAVLDQELTEKLADHYAKKLISTPTDHDKVEFKIVYSCYFLNLSEKIKELLSEGFSELEVDRIKFSLLQLTNKIISKRDGLYRTDQERIAKLDQKFIEVRDSKLPTIDKIYWLIEDCKRYGTLPFAGLARAGFIAVQLLRSMVDLQIITASEFNRYLKSLNTVSKQLVNDFGSYRKNQKTKQQILDKYGHLRPGTYDILSARYDEAFDVYFSEDSITNNHLEEEGEHFEFSDSHKEKISFHLAQNGIMVSVDELMEFIKEAIEGREYSKFVFTRSLSHVLLLIDQLGSSVGISKEDMSYVDVKTILSLYSSVTSLDLGSILKENIQRNKAEYEVTKAIKLPEIITDPSKIYSFYVGESEPNFVTQNRIVETVILESQLTSADLKDRIVMIRSADPGYDWLFSRNIAGLVTMYGGSNSHMAIRCAELQIPAAIGCGERLFDQLSQSSMIEIDCASRQIRKIN